ncbi:MAG: gamma-glutamylcyclotransferase family protein [Thermodesulfobacteriota bacterium]
MGTDFMFAYGAGMNYSDLRSWLESNGFNSALVLNRWPAQLDGYEIVWNYYSRRLAGGMVNIQPKTGSSVFGVLIEFEEQLLKAIDRKEGHPYFYARGDHRIPVARLADGKAVPAWVYIAQANKGGRTDILPTRDYRKIILDGATEEKLPEAYLDTIRSWSTEN